MKKATIKQKDKIREFIKGGSNSYKEARICDCLDEQQCYEPDPEEYKDYDECDEMIVNYRCGFCHSKELQDKFLDKLNIVEASQIITNVYVSDLNKLIKREREFLEMFTRTTDRLIEEGHMGNVYGDIHDQPAMEEMTYWTEDDVEREKTYGREFDDLEKYLNIKTNILKINQNILERYGR
jgi:hypothetical protein